jgi:prepilin-type processing-associated H-X9-DG protein
MKPLSAKANNQGITLLEILVVLFLLLILSGILWPEPSTARKRAETIACMSNLKQIDFGFLMYASDNGGKFPMQASSTSGGTMELINRSRTFPQFQKTSKYLPDLRVLVCPADKTRAATSNYATLTDSNLSYFLNIDVSTNNPAHSILSGDRFLQVNGRPINPGLFILTTNLNMGWTPDRHLGRGNLAFADGHAEISTKTNLNAIVQNQPLATNRLSIP